MHGNTEGAAVLGAGTAGAGSGFGADDGIGAAGDGGIPAKSTARPAAATTAAAWDGESSRGGTGGSGDAACALAEPPPDDASSPRPLALTVAKAEPGMEPEPRLWVSDGSEYIFCRSCLAFADKVAKFRLSSVAKYAGQFWI